MLLVSGAGIAFAGPASSATPAWSVVPSVSPRARRTARSEAWRAPRKRPASPSATPSTGVLMEQWNGTGWSIVPPRDGSVLLYDVACPSATSCFVVGFARIANKDTPIIESWDGTTWSVVPSPEIARRRRSSRSRARARRVVSRSAGPARTSSSSGTARRGRSCRPASGEVEEQLLRRRGLRDRNGLLRGRLVVRRQLFAAADRALERDRVVDRRKPGPDQYQPADPQLGLVSGAASCFAVGSIEIYSAHSAMTKTLIERWNGVEVVGRREPDVRRDR